MSDRALRLACGLVCAGLSIACLWFVFQPWQLGETLKASRASFIIALFAFALLFGLTAVSVVLQWGIARPLALASGSFLALYAGAVVVIGWEDVGGARGAIPLVIITGGGGVINLLAARRARQSLSEAA